jgi:hypothetical protein
MSRRNKVFGTTNLVDKQDAVSRIILNIAKKRNQIIYGARSIQAQNNLFARNTKDYDIFDKNPKATANLVQKELDKTMGFDYFFTKEAEHKGTWKVKGKGQDLKANTEDDESIADYTKPDKKIPFVMIRGIKYRLLKEELKRKQATIKDPEFKFRHEKDRDDVNRIKGFIKVRNIVNGGMDT